jgi:muconolactone delta-isomerase
MLFLVISSPAPEQPDRLKEARLTFLSWAEELQQQQKILHYYPRVGRGVAAVFNVESNDQLHEFLTEWMNMVPATFEIYPLIDPSYAKTFLASES